VSWLDFRVILFCYKWKLKKTDTEIEEKERRFKNQVRIFKKVGNRKPYAGVNDLWENIEIGTRGLRPKLI
jgi:hypothetical protein